MLEKLKTKIAKATPFSLTGANKQSQPLTKNKERKVHFCNVDDVEFYFLTDSQKEFQTKKSKMMKLYNEEYLKQYGTESLCVQIAGQQYFCQIIATNQPRYRFNRLQLSSAHKDLQAKIFQTPRMLKHFWTIQFPRLKVLNLSQHNLSSLEPMEFMNLPSLNILQIHSNNIRSFEPLVKVSMPRLKILTVYQNRAPCIQKLSRCNIPQIQEFEFDKDETKQKTKLQNLQFLFKTPNFGMIKKIYMHDDNRIYKIKQNNIFNTLYHKLIKLQVSNYMYFDIFTRFKRDMQQIRRLREIQD